MKIAKNNVFIILATVLTSIAVFVFPFLAKAVSVQHDFPRVAAWNLNTGKALSEVSTLARHDTVILNMNAHETHPQLIAKLRSLNPDIIILAYTNVVDFPIGRLNEVEPRGYGIWHDFGRGLQDSWYLKTWRGEPISTWPGHKSLNPNNPAYASYAANFYVDRLLASGKYDGIFFDTIWETISWMNEDIDINGDGGKDTRPYIDQNWHNGQNSLFNAIRTRIGDRYLLITNGDGKFADVNDGRMFESFPEFYEGGWTGSIERYLDTDSDGFGTRFNMINVDTNNTGNFQDYATMRYGLTSTLLANGYYNFDYGTSDRSYVNYYDEFSVSLGAPVKSAINLLTTASAQITPGLWRRDFVNGISIVNSSSQTRTIQLAGDYEKINGRQDRRVNNGAVVNHVTLSPRDGVILLRPLQEVLGNPFQNGNFARVFSSDTSRVRASFFSYDDRFAGSTKILKHDVDDDGRIETLVAGKSNITIYADNGAIKAVFYPYTAAYNRGINFGIGDLNGDGTQEIITGTDQGGGPQIRIFNAQGRLINPGFFAYATNFRGGVNVAVGDLNNDGINEIIAGAGYSGGPHIRVFNKDGRLINPGFFAYDPAFRGGVNVAVGDINGDGTDEIISGAGRGGGPHVRVWDKDGRMLSEFFAFSAQSSAGVRVAAYDFDNDRRDEIIAMTDDFFLLGQ